jgi:chemotaxis protein histidine kinase CheA/ActR/RegA family two-component response regulator
MSFELNPAILESITQEARQCFLEEDAPGYLDVLQIGIKQIAQNKPPNYKALMRAAHSIKGGAGVAQMSELSGLAHQLEDLLEAGQQHRIADRQLAATLLQQGLEELAYLLGVARDTGEIVAPEANLMAAIAQLNAQCRTAQRPLEPELKSLSPARIQLVRTALESDLEACLQRIEKLLVQPVEDAEKTQALHLLAEEGTLLGEAYQLPWLIATVAKITDLLETPPPNASIDEIAKLSIGELRHRRKQYLQQVQSANATDATPRSPGKLTAPQPLANTQLRIPLQRLDEMGSSVSELLIAHERLIVQQQLLKQASQSLRRVVEQVKPARDRVQSLYDRSSTLNSAGSIEGEFDPIELDRYTALHSSLQTFEELITQVQEARVDLDLIGREFGRDLTQIRQNLAYLYEEITTSRLVPFKLFAQRFVPQLRHNAKRSGKKVELKVSGENVLVDKVLLEQLQTPLTQILNNAIAHGIETPAERSLLDKPETAQLFLGAKTEAGEVAITFADDGRGIDLKQVYQKALDRGLCPPHVAMNQLPRQSLLNLIFQPGFSTAEQVSDLSGRGVGMDIVRQKIQQLRGSIDVETMPGQGTTFTIRLPLSMSLLSLLLCRVAEQTIAIPADTVLDVIPLLDAADLGNWGAKASEAVIPEPYHRSVEGSGRNGADTAIPWRGQMLPLSPLLSMLPYPERAIGTSQPRVVLVLKGNSGPIAVTVDRIADERQLILKSFDDTVVVPPYVAGCTVLGTGEAVPVILPRFLKSVEPLVSLPVSRSHTSASRTILVAEDSTGARRSLERILAHAGYRVVACRDGQKAIEQLQVHAGAIDLVISDVEMPVLNGFELLGKIRSHPVWYTLPVVMLTSRMGDRHHQKAISLGANAYLGKPVTPTELLAGIENLLPSH